MRRGLYLVGGDSNEMLCDSSLVLGLVQKPGSGRLGVSNGLLSCECLRSDGEKSCLWLDLLEHLSEVGAIDVGHKVDTKRASIGLQCLRHHQGTKVAASNSNVNDIRDTLSCVSEPFT